MDNGEFAAIITLMVIIGAIKTRRCTEFLFLGAVLGVLKLYGVDAPLKFVKILEDVVGSKDNVWLWLVCGLFGSLIALLEESKGTYGFQHIIGRICKTARSTKVCAFILGILIFIDDYLNVLAIGACMKNLFDKRKIPRETLAYILDSTGAPVCVLIPVSTWAVFYSKLFYEEEAIRNQFSSGLNAYIKALPYCFYPVVALLIVLLFCLGWFPKLGAMKKAYKRVETTGKTYSDASKKYNQYVHTDVDGKVSDFLIPILVLVVIGIGYNEILLGVISAILCCYIMYIPRKILTAEKFLDKIIDGFATMLPVFFLLVAAFSLADVTSELGLTEFLIDKIVPIASKELFPAIAFLLLSVLAFVTGSNWGMSALVIPVFIPMCMRLNANLILTMAAIISGGAFGSHACLFTDATVLSSESAGIDNMEHALTQWPYVFISAVISTILFVIFGFTLN